MNLKIKALTTVALLFTIVSLIYVIIEIREYDKDLQWAISREERSLDSILTLVERHLSNHYAHSLKSILQDESIIAAFTQQDRDLLYQATLPKYLELKLRSNAELNMHFHLPGGTSFLRMHLPEQYGDDLEGIRPVIQAVHQIQRARSAYEIGRHGCFFRIVEPILQSGQYIGAVEIGIPVKIFPKAIHEQLGIDTSVYFKTERWNKVRKAHYKFHASGDYTIVHENPVNCCILTSAMDLSQDNHNENKVGDKTTIAHNLPIFHDYKGNIIGGLLACQDISPFIQRKEKFIRSTITLMLVLFLCFMGVMYFTLGRLMDRLEKGQQKQKDLLGSLELEILERQRSERERSSLQAQLLQSQKMEALGLLSGGVAHDFNNLLTTIMGYAQLILTDKGLDEKIKKQVDAIAIAGDRATNLIRQLLAFSRSQPIDMKPVNLAVIIEDLSKMINRLIGEDVELILDVNKEKSVIMGDKSQLEQILMNLSVNARDAMPRGGLLTITSKQITIEKEVRCAFSDVPPGTYVRLSVSDTGYGIDKKIAERIFEPFFTTKAEGKGTGLGLSTVFGIIKQHNGHICVESEIGKGTVFKMAFPANLRRKDDRVRHQSVSTDLLQGNETILVIEDEAPIREVVEEILVSLGYTVYMAKDKTDAESIFASKKELIQLVLTDLILPGINGHELFLKLNEEKPELKVVYMSGYSEEVLTKYNIDINEIEFIKKPLTINSVAAAIRKTLERE